LDGTEHIGGFQHLGAAVDGRFKLDRLEPGMVA
jgi:hypothetical protein